MESIEFDVQGSAEYPYRVRFVKRSEANLSAYCTCPAGENGQYCKHRFSILEGSIKGIIGKEDRLIGKVRTVLSWLSGTDVEQAIYEMRTIEQELADVKKKLSAAKRTVAKAMRD